MKFSKIIGHKKVKEHLIHTVVDGRISHAQLFLGKEGRGNLAMAIAYAQYISCVDKQKEDSCGECPSCVKYNKLAHPDLHFIVPVATSPTVKTKPVTQDYIAEWREINTDSLYFSLAQWQEKIDTGNKRLLISKEESIEILKILSLKTYESEYKVVIIWYPERFNIASANKLLKAIEEPPEKTLFLLVAQDSEQIISTILSRTQLVKVGRIEDDELEEALQTAFHINENKAKEVAHLSEGNYIEAKKIIEHSQVEEAYLKMFIKWMRSAFVADILGLIEWSEEIASKGYGREKQVHFLNYGLRIFRESLMQNYADPSLGRSGKSAAQFLQKFAPYIHGANCIEVIELFSDAIYHVERNANPKILFLDVSLKLTKLLRVKAPLGVE